VTVAADASGRVDVRAVLTDLGQRGLLHVLLEGGGEVHASFLTRALVDEVIAIIAPKLVGGRAAPGPLGGSGAKRMAEALALADLRAARLGDDVLLRGRLGQWGSGGTNASPGASVGKWTLSNV